MTGYNHRSDCTCGWCTGGWRGTVDLDPRWQNLEDSFTIPNAKCPVCGESVFFYKSPFGGRVFFDELGPPWPKHPCTDSSTAFIASPLTALETQPQWKQNGWQPIKSIQIEQIGEWAKLRIHTFGSRRKIDRLTPWSERLSLNEPTHIKQLGTCGTSRISGLHRGIPYDEILAHFTLCHVSPSILAEALVDVPSSAFQVGIASYQPWEKFGRTRSGRSYPSFVDFSIARYWLELAQGLNYHQATSALNLINDLESNPKSRFITRGSRIRHKDFGDGNVVQVDGKKLIIEFDAFGIKKVLATFVEIT